MALSQSALRISVAAVVIILLVLLVLLRRNSSPETYTTESSIGSRSGDDKNEYPYIDDFRQFRSFMEDRSRNGYSMDAAAASFAFAGAFYSGQFALDHTPLEVVEELSSLRKGVPERQILNRDFSIDAEQLDEVKETVHIYTSIELNGVFSTESI
jgi:hypothetical protein